MKQPLPSAGLLALLMVTGAAACRDKPDPNANIASFPAAFSTLILPNRATFISRSGSPDALELVFRAPDQPEAVLAYYRRQLKPPTWQVVSDGKDNTGAYVILAQQDGPPLWVRIWPDTAFNATYVSLTGAVDPRRVDSMVAAKARAEAEKPGKAEKAETTKVAPQ